MSILIPCKSNEPPHKEFIEKFKKKIKKSTEKNFLNRIDEKFNKDEELNKALNNLMKEINRENSEDIIKSATKIWKALVKESIYYLFIEKEAQKSPRSGELEDLKEFFGYFDQFVEFEELVYGADNTYRDHFLHSLWVYFIGVEYLDKIENIILPEVHFEEHYEGTPLYEFHELKMREREENNEHIPKEENENKPSNNQNKNETCSKQREIHTEIMNKKHGIWCFIALTHDLGYPLEKLEKIRKSQNNILEKFDFPEIPKYTPRIFFAQERILEYILRIINTRIGLFEKQHKPYQDGDECKEIKEEITKDKTKDKLIYKYYIRKDWNVLMAKNLLDYTHGMMSCYILVKYLKLFYMNTLIDENFEYYGDWAKSFIIKREILKAINFHSDKNTSISHLFSFQSYLFLIDLFEDISRWTRAKKFRRFESNTCQIKNIEFKASEKEIKFKIKLNYQRLEGFDFFKEIFVSKIKEFMLKIDHTHFPKKNNTIDFDFSMENTISDCKKPNYYQFHLGMNESKQIYCEIISKEYFNQNTTDKSNNEDLVTKITHLKIQFMNQLELLKEIFFNKYNLEITLNLSMDIEKGYNIETKLKKKIDEFKFEGKISDNFKLIKSEKRNEYDYNEELGLIYKKLCK